MRLLVALHGFTGQSTDYDPLASELSRERRLIAPDLPGHGTRGGLRDTDAYTLDAHLRLIDAAAGSGPVDLLGYSLGGRLALHWALTRPERLSRLILVGASPGLKTEDERVERRASDAALGDFIRSRGVATFFRYWHSQTMFRTLLGLPKERLAGLLLSRGDNDPEGLALSLSHVGTGALPSLWHRLHELKVPVDLITGSEDVKFTAIGREMVTLIPRARHGEVEGAGHAVHLERPADLAAAILRR